VRQVQRGLEQQEPPVRTDRHQREPVSEQQVRPGLQEQPGQLEQTDRHQPEPEPRASASEQARRARVQPGQMDQLDRPGPEQALVSEPDHSASEPVQPGQTDRQPPGPARELALAEQASGPGPEQRARTDQLQPERASAAPVQPVSEQVRPASEQPGQTDRPLPAAPVSAERASVPARRVSAVLVRLQPVSAELARPVWVQPVWVQRASAGLVLPEPVQRASVLPASAERAQRELVRVFQPVLVRLAELVSQEPVRPELAQPERRELEPASAARVAHRRDFRVRGAGPSYPERLRPSRAAEHSPCPAALAEPPLVAPSACRRTAPVGKPHNRADNSANASDKRGPCSGRRSRSPAKRRLA
jgi:hypothetical protein